MASYSEFEIDAIKEMVSIGTAKAAEALSALIDRKVMINVPDARMVALTEVPGLLNGHSQVITGLYFKMSGDFEGSILLFFPEETADRLGEFMIAGLKEAEPGIKQSALMEMGNILVNSYVNAMAAILDSRILISPPMYANDFLESVIDTLLIEVAEKADTCLFMETGIFSDGMEQKGNFIMFPDAPSLDKMLKKMGVK